MRQAHTVYGPTIADVTTGGKNICGFGRALLQCSVTVAAATDQPRLALNLACCRPRRVSQASVERG